MKNIEEQLKIIKRGIVEIVPEEELLPKLKKSAETGKPLRIKLGVDPTAPDIHLGFTVVIRKMRQLQDLGHRAVLIVGDYTATVGDPSGKNATRAMLSHEEVLENAKTYQEQFFRIVDKEQCEVVYNGEWFKKLNFSEVIHLSSQITVAQMLEREDFKKRYTAGQSISLHEFMYPLMQGYDSVEIKSDIELGGTDQKFNVLVGRDLQKSSNMEPQIGIFMPILLGTDGKEKMSKSLGNYIGINESAQSMFHKLINIPDSIVSNYYELLTDKPVEDIKKMESDVKSGTLDPRVWKADLAKDITAQYHGQEKSLEAEAQEKKIHAGGTIPEDTKTFEIDQPAIGIIDALVECGLVPTKSEGRRMIQNGGVKVDSNKIEDFKLELELEADKEILLQVGKRKFAKIKGK